MSIKDFFNVSKIKAENDELKKLLTPEMKDIITLKKEIEALNLESDSLKNEISNLNSIIINKKEEILSMENTIKDKRKQIIILDDEILVQECGIYEPKFDFAKSLDYSAELTSVRYKQKELIKNNQAVSGNLNWQVNGSTSKGKKMVSDTQKLLLRAFNNECDELVSKVKHTNFDAYLAKMSKSAETISKLGSVMDISITQKYLDLKIKELILSHEYQNKKQEEKERIKEAKAKEREEAKTQKELEEQKRKIEKEQTHYRIAFDRIVEQISNNPENLDLINKKKELENRLSNIETSLADIDYRQENLKAGYVYIISNIGSFGENIYKIGMTRRLDPRERIDELGDASVPFNFDIHAMIFSDNAPALEAALHKAFESKKLNMVNQRREFFNVSLDEIKSVVKKNFDKTVEFIDTPDAEQYRISLKMRQNCS